MSLFLQCVLPINPISLEEFDKIISSAELVVADRIGPKVMKLPNNNLLKIFRCKRLFSSALFAPYAVRFINNAFKLKELGISSIQPVKIVHCRKNNSYAVEYEPLEGELLRSILQASDNSRLLEKTARFIAELHKKGVYFRSLHFENVIYYDGVFGLIDVADMKIYSGSLSQSLRKRNFQHFLRYPQDMEILKKFGLDKFETLYQQY